MKKYEEEKLQSLKDKLTIVEDKMKNGDLSDETIRERNSILVNIKTVKVNSQEHGQATPFDEIRFIGIKRESYSD
jgi:hypothetical protein